MQSALVKVVPILAVVLVVAGGLKLVSSGHSPGSGGHSMPNHGEGKLKEGGQSTLAALIEVINVFEADDKTDWNAINIDGLRSHLLDMNDLVINTNAVTEMINDNEIRFNVVANGGNDSLGAIHRMVQAHSRFIEQSRGWTITPTVNDEGAAVTITTNNSDDLIRLKALGFYGFMSLDSHHQAHHYQIAMGVGH